MNGLTHADMAEIISAVIGGCFPILGLWLKHRMDVTDEKITETHMMVNSRMDELLELTRKSSRAEGMKDQKAISTEEAVRIAGAQAASVSVGKSQQVGQERM